jgi:hypothetical protein
LDGSFKIRSASHKNRENGQILPLASFFVTLLFLLTWGLLLDLGRHTATFLSDESLIHQEVADQLRVASTLNALASNNSQMRRLFSAWIDAQATGYSHVSNLIWSSLLWEKGVPIPSPFNPLGPAKTVDRFVWEKSFGLARQNQTLLNLLPVSVKAQLNEELLTNSLCALLRTKNSERAPTHISHPLAIHNLQECSLALNKAVLAPPSYRRIGLLDILPRTLVSWQGFVNFNLNAPFRSPTAKEQNPLTSRTHRLLREIVFIVHPRLCHSAVANIKLPCPSLPSPAKELNSAWEAGFEPRWSVHVVP